MLRKTMLSLVAIGTIAVSMGLFSSKAQAQSGYQCNYQFNPGQTRIQPILQQPFGRQPIGRQPFVQQPFGQQRFVQQPIGRQPFVQQPFGQQRFVQQPIGQQPFGQQLCDQGLVAPPVVRPQPQCFDVFYRDCPSAAWRCYGHFDSYGVAQLASLQLRSRGYFVDVR